MIVYILHSSCFWEIWGLYKLWIFYDQLYHAPCLACLALFGSMIPAMCNCKSMQQLLLSIVFSDNCCCFFVHIVFQNMFERIIFSFDYGPTMTTQRKKTRTGIRNMHHSIYKDFEDFFVAHFLSKILLHITKFLRENLLQKMLKIQIYWMTHISDSCSVCLQFSIYNIYLIKLLLYIHQF